MNLFRIVNDCNCSLKVDGHAYRILGCRMKIRGG